MTRCWCGRPAHQTSACGCCTEHDNDAHTLARVRALVTEHPDTEVPIVRLDDLRQALGDQ